jgi:magnesium transporter
MHKDMLPPVIRVIQYGAGALKEQEITEVERLRHSLTDDTVTWIDVQGFGDEAVLRGIADLFSIHPLAIEDVVNVPQRPKAETYDEHQLVITRMSIMPAPLDLETEQVSLFVGKNYVITFQERYGDVLDPVRARIRRGGWTIRKHGPDYLAYAIIDAIIDGYYPILEMLGDYLESLEERALSTPTPETLRAVHSVKQDLLALRRIIWPHREAINELIRDDTPMVSEPVRVYLRDCYDHCVQIIDVLESYRDIAGGLMEVYLSSVANRQNDVMKVLTIMATIFIPLTFMAGLYGMNFENMPELHWPWAYPVLLAAMVLTAMGMVVVFRRKGWIGSSQSEPHEDEPATRR